MANKFAAPQFEAVMTLDLPYTVIADLLTKPPVWTRLEPQSLSGNPDTWLEARVHDPLWMLGRQWQAGEFAGEDCGTPVSVDVVAQTQAVIGFRPGRPDEALSRRELPPGSVIEPEVEREPWTAPGLADRILAGQALLRTLSSLGFAADLPKFPPAELIAAANASDPGWLLAARNSPDAEACAVSLEAGAAVWLAGAPVAADAAAKDWLSWYRRNVSPSSADTSCWQPSRLEYTFGLDTGTDPGARHLEAPLHDGGELDWYSFNLRPAAAVAAPGTVVSHSARVHASRIRYAGMPADRLWEFEDGLVNFGTMDVQPNDLVRLCFVEFAMLCGNDWLIAPIDLPRGTLAAISSVSYRTTFGETFSVDAAQDSGRRGRFSMFSTSRTDGMAVTEPVFFLPPGGRNAHESAPLEEVVFARDETANMAWAIETLIEGPDGQPRDRRREPMILDPLVPAVAGVDMIYQLETQVPPWWVPLVPVALSGFDGGFMLRKGSFSAIDGAKSRVLHPTPFDLHDEEVPREGVRLRRVVSVMRDEEGVLQRWVARRVAAAGGESSSSLAYDNTYSAV